ncbi:MAG: TAXI family TRAP transporter solute-binding subunit [Xanthobacteraceae bacterium]
MQSNLTVLKTAAFACLLMAALAMPASAQQTYSLGTNPQGSLAYGAGSALAKLMNEKGNMLARVRAGGGSSTIIPQMNRGQIDFGFNNALEARYAYIGKGPFDGKPNKNLRLVAEVFPLWLGFVVAEDSGIKTLADAKGKRIPCKFTAQIILADVQDAMLASAGLTDKDFECVPVADYIKGQDLLPQGKVDIAMAGPTSGATKEGNAQLRSRGGITFISIGHSDADIAAMQKVFPEATARLVKKDTASTIRNDTYLIEYPFFLTAGAQVPDEVVYKVVKLMAANKDMLGESFAPFKRFDPQNMDPKHSTPYHPGAIKAYKEMGLWNR